MVKGCMTSRGEVVKGCMTSRGEGGWLRDV